jgi:hypothetical protein
MKSFHASMIVVFCVSDIAIKEDLLYEEEQRSRRQLCLEKLVLAGSDTCKGFECTLPFLIDMDVKYIVRKSHSLTHRKINHNSSASWNKYFHPHLFVCGIMCYWVFFQSWIICAHCLSPTCFYSLWVSNYMAVVWEFATTYIVCAVKICCSIENCPLCRVSVSVSFLVLQFPFQSIIRLLSKLFDYYPCSVRSLSRQGPATAKAVSGCYQRIVKWLSTQFPAVTKQCTAAVTAVSGYC